MEYFINMDVWKYRLFETPVSLISAISLFLSCFYHLSFLCCSYHLSFLCCFYHLSFLFLWSHISPDALFDHVSVFLFVRVLLLSRLISKYLSLPGLMSTEHHLVLIVIPSRQYMYENVKNCGCWSKREVIHCRAGVYSERGEMIPTLHSLSSFMSVIHVRHSCQSWRPVLS